MLVRNVILSIRNAKLPDPAVIGSAGSFFKNPVIPRSDYERIASVARIEHGADYEVPHYDAGSGFIKVPAAWLLDQCGLHSGMRVLELGSGNGNLWTENRGRIPENLEIVVSDISEGMLRDARREIGWEDERFHFETVDAHRIPFPVDSFDLVIANHMLFYCEDIPLVCREVRRVLREGGVFVCSTYSSRHMKEISELVQGFDSRITLSADRLYEKFGLENGRQYLEPYFRQVEMRMYEDRLLVDRPEPLVEYVLSCHGNQNQYLLDRYKDFRNYVEQKTSRVFEVTKEAGVFVSR